MSIRKPTANPILSLVCFLFVLALTACSQGTPPLPTPSQPNRPAPGSGPLTLTLWHTRTGAEQNELVALARDFTKEYKDVTVTPVYVGNEEELKNKLVAAIALNQPPDLILAPRRDIPAFVEQDGLVPLDDLSADASLGLNAQDQSDLFPGILDEGVYGQFNGQRYSFPFDLDGMVLFYNADLLQSGSYNAPPATWVQFADMASKLTKDEQFGWGMNIDADVFAGMLVSQGSAPLDRPERRTLFDERAGLASMTLAAQLYKSGAAQLEPTRANAILDFAQGQAGFYIDWMSALPELTAAQKKGKPFAIGVSNLPQGDPQDLLDWLQGRAPRDAGSGAPPGSARDAYMLATGSDLALLRTTPDRERQAWFLLRWLTGAKQTARWASVTHAIPLRASALPLINPDANPLLSQIQKGLGTTVPHFVPRSAHPRIDRIDGVMEQAWADSLQTKADIGAILAAAGTNADAILTGNP